MQNFNPIKSSNKPLYIDVYDQLFTLIIDGTLTPESKLPPEVELAKKFGVSRMTLRQALSLLQDDGLLKSIHGRGSFVTKAQPKHSSPGLEIIGHPIYKCYSKEIDDVEMNFRLDLESDYTKQVLGKSATAVVAFERWYKWKKNAIAYAFSFMAIDTISELKVDLNNHEQLKDMLENQVYDLANSITYDIKHSASANSYSQKYDIEGSEECVLLLESIYTTHHNPIIYNKHYIPKEYCTLKVNATK